MPKQRETTKLQYNPTRAAVGVILADAHDPTDNLPALLNPQSLDISIELAVGKLNPIGASHDTKQYSHTVSPSFPITLYFSAELAARLEYEVPDIRTAVNWLAAHGYGREAGLAPDNLLILWPNVLSLEYAVERIEISYSRFSRMLGVKAATVTLEGGEIRTDFHTKSRHMEDGFMRPGYEDVIMTGPPLYIIDKTGRKI